MYISLIFSSWRQSLTIFRPLAIKALCVRAYRELVYAGAQIWSLYRFFIITVLFQLLVIHGFMRSYEQYHVMYVLAAVMLAVSVMFIDGVMVLLLRSRSDQYAVRDYLRIYFARYLLLRMFFIALVAIISYLLSVFDPAMILVLNTTSVITILKISSLVTLFFWLDAKLRLKNMFIAFERATNLIFYNVPFFIVMMFIFMLSMVAVESSVTFFDHQYWLSAMILLIIKGCVTVIQFFLTSLLYQFYKQRRNKEYAESLIE